VGVRLCKPAGGQAGERTWNQITQRPINSAEKGGEEERCSVPLGRLRRQGRESMLQMHAIGRSEPDLGWSEAQRRIERNHGATFMIIGNPPCYHMLIISSGVKETGLHKQEGSGGGSVGERGVLGHKLQQEVNRRLTDVEG